LTTTLRRIQGRAISIALLLIVDVAVISLSFYAAAAIRFDFDIAEILSRLDPFGPRLLFFTFFVLIGLASVGMYRRRQRPNKRQTISRAAVAVLIGGFSSVVFFYVMPSLYTGRGMLATAMFLSTVGLSVARISMLRLLDVNPIKRRVLVLGSGWLASRVSMLRRRSDRRAFEIIGYVPASEAEVALSKRFDISPLIPLSNIDTVGEIDEIVVAVDDRRDSFPVDQLLIKKSRGAAVTDIVSFLERETEQIELDVMRSDWLVFAKIFPRSTFFDSSKRLFDLLAGSALTLLTLPVGILVAIAIKLEDGLDQPIFYRQKRVGRYGEVYDLFKIRSMNSDAESRTGPQWSSRAGDLRVTRVGAFIRRFRLDELPQLINVIRGDMSLVGPRPERPEFVQTLTDKVPFYDFRHSMRPGLTGWAQLNFPYGSSIEDARMKHKYDLYYIKNATLVLDLLILLQTVEVVLWGKAVSMAGPVANTWTPDVAWKQDDLPLNTSDDAQRDIA
jgi:sugar transferase (PEP-CTERM system associated)